MAKGGPSMGKHNKTTHIKCRRCGRHSYNKKTSECSACGFGKSTKMNRESWRWKTPTRQARKK